MGHAAGNAGRGEGQHESALSRFARSDAKAQSRTPRKAIRADLRALLDAELDSEIERTARACRSAHAARRIRIEAEHEATHVPIGPRAKRGQLSLFIVPLVLVFGHDVPGSRLDAALWRLALSRTLLRQAIAPLLGDSTVIVPRFIELEELRALPPSSVRKSALAFAAGRMDEAVVCLETASDRPARIGAVFARFLMGKCDGRSSRTRAVQVAALRDGVHEAMFEALGAPVRVGAWLYRDFYSGLFEGMWRYQAECIVRMCERVRAAGSPHDPLVAVIEFPASPALPDRMRVIVEDVAGHASRAAAVIRCRPSETVSQSVERASAPLKLAGVARIKMVVRAVDRAKGKRVGIS